MGVNLQKLSIPNIPVKHGKLLSGKFKMSAPVMRRLGHVLGRKSINLTSCSDLVCSFQNKNATKRCFHGIAVVETERHHCSRSRWHSKCVKRTKFLSNATSGSGLSCQIKRGLSTVILGIESSCDDTGAAVVDEKGNVLGEALHSQSRIHVA